MVTTNNGWCCTMIAVPVERGARQGRGGLTGLGRIAMVVEGPRWPCSMNVDVHDRVWRGDERREPEEKNFGMLGHRQDSSSQDFIKDASELGSQS